MDSPGLSQRLSQRTVALHSRQAQPDEIPSPGTLESILTTLEELNHINIKTPDGQTVSYRKDEFFQMLHDRMSFKVQARRFVATVASVSALVTAIFSGFTWFRDHIKW